MGRIFGLAAAALMVCVFALPANAGNDKKQYSLVMSVPPGQPPTAPFTVKATIKNVGNSSIHSFQLFVTGVTIVGVKKLDDAKVAFNGSTITVTKADDLESGESRTLTITVNSCGDGQWLASVWNGAQLNGQSFALVPSPVSNLTSSIPCGPPLAAGDGFAVPDSNTNDCVVSGHRGAYDKDGGVPTTVPYFVTNTVQPTTGGLVHFRWPVDSSGGPNFDKNAAFEYTITCPFGPFTETDFAWFTIDGTGTPATSATGTPDFINADTIPGCLPTASTGLPSLPAPYGTLESDLNDTDTVSRIAVDTTVPSGVFAPPGAPQFDIVIGTERMTVTACEDSEEGTDGSDLTECAEHEGLQHWTVTRAVGGTKLAAHTHSPTTLVMYTPLPIMTMTQGVNGQYKAGNQAMMCVVDQGDNGSEGHPATTHFTMVIDIGDGHVQGP